LSPRYVNLLPIAHRRDQKGGSQLIKTQVNPDIVGGLVVEIGDRTIDLSVSSKINKLNKALTDAL
jgi:F-type H+-transporting ATPase subunit O